MFKNRILDTFIASTFVVAFCCISCSGKKEKRPSPLVVDSIQVENTTIKIEYSSPAVRKRKIWGELVPYGEIWRTGANRASFIELDGDLVMEGKKIPAGKYSIFTIPTDSSWTIIFNEDWDQWGAFNYNQELDIIRWNIYPQKSSFDERMKFTLDNNALKFDWEELSWSLQFEPKL
ncbi:MAG: hypothetical protein CMB80_17935 [Flammeovirgaceae bacterium]|nr:hypothetical protein [Flammeovirgaceae bacterium]MBR06718.1 hypothetical protein [Rickettsiales bacterium]|tara:strand:+ start:59 stop:586 length:528 start_codon:yes stop_codon:yes gene_type:complete